MEFNKILTLGNLNENMKLTRYDGSSYASYLVYEYNKLVQVSRPYRVENSEGKNVVLEFISNPINLLQYQNLRKRGFKFLEDICKNYCKDENYKFKGVEFELYTPQFIYSRQEELN